MSKGWIILIIFLVIVIAGVIAIYLLGRKMQKRQEENEAQMEAMAQNVSMLVIDKKMLKMKDAGLPQQVIDNTPKLGRLNKYPIVKAKVGPKIMTFICDPSAYDLIPVKRECKVSVSGLYINKILSARGGLEPPKKKKKGAIGRLLAKGRGEQ